MRACPSPGPGGLALQLPHMWQTTTPRSSATPPPVAPEAFPGPHWPAVSPAVPPGLYYQGVGHSCPYTPAPVYGGPA